MDKWAPILQITHGWVSLDVYFPTCYRSPLDSKYQVGYKA